MVFHSFRPAEPCLLQLPVQGETLVLQTKRIDVQTMGTPRRSVHLDAAQDRKKNCSPLCQNWRAY
jgi:hypothetical protein